MSKLNRQLAAENFAAKEARKNAMDARKTADEPVEPEVEIELDEDE